MLTASTTIQSKRGGLANLTLVLFLLLSASCGTESRNVCGEHPNPFGLEVIHCLENYKNQVEKNPEMEMVDLQKVIPEAVLDIRYATKNNFTGELIYTAPKAYARKPVAVALKKVQDSLEQKGLGLKIYDAYRPYAATVRFFEVYPDPDFVADPATGSRHNRGCAVDVTLIDLSSGREIAMPTDFDEFTERAHPEFSDLPDEVKANRDFLLDIMGHFGFKNYPTEWWHFDFEGWENFPLMDLSFEDLEKALAPGK